jgi:glycerate kinase
LTDVTAPLLGPLGAARQFGPQKGADEDDVDLLERALTHWSRVLGGDGERPGAGAAGGIAYALATVWDAVTSQGADVVGRLVGLPGAIAASDLVVTGEGRLDDQSFQGKVVGNVDRLAREDGCRVAIVCGKDTTTGSPLAHVVETAGLAGSVEAAVADPDRWLVTAGRALAATAITTPEMTGTRQRT